MTDSIFRIATKLNPDYVSFGSLMDIHTTRDVSCRSTELVACEVCSVQAS